MSSWNTHKRIGEGHRCPSRGFVCSLQATRMFGSNGFFAANGSPASNGSLVSYRFGVETLSAALAGDPESAGPGP
jgi:hypothetical protein